MSKILTSPVKRWPGTVTIADPLSLPQYIAFKASYRLLGQLRAVETSDDPDPLAEFQLAVLPGLLPCIEKVEIPALPHGFDPFPATPRQSSIELFTWLYAEIASLAAEADDRPNA